jgi:sulfur relay (sulfurtransferase) complex TusBCD TusD component (DsrE family)
MPSPGKKLGLLISASPSHPNFHHGLALARTALNRGMTVYLYCIDDAVTGLANPHLQSLKSEGLHLFACAFAAQKRKLPLNQLATFAGLTMLSELMANTDRFVSLN